MPASWQQKHVRTLTKGLCVKVESWRQRFVEVSSVDLCNSPYFEWDEVADDDPLMELEHVEALEEQSQPWPSLAYFGSMNWRAIAESTPTLHASETGYVYHLLDIWGRAVYVGKSKRPSSRIPGHRSKPWWRQVARVRIFSSMEYHLLEMADIKELMPRYNVIGVR